MASRKHPMPTFLTYTIFLVDLEWEMTSVMVKWFTTPVTRVTPLRVAAHLHVPNKKRGVTLYQSVKVCYISMNQQKDEVFSVIGFIREKGSG